ncbi:phospho-N-acetylmuramoyl-pentapeptide-transferase [bacterium SCSIO 12643]|nr:phospho-N-acetylmuramoyl-pentapeptide-transferase [bacterium SCSIO 12643]
MLYYLFEYLQELGMPGAGLFQYISFRAAMAIVVSLLISMVFGGRIIDLIRKQQVGESVRDLGLEGQMEKAGTPTMGGLIILASILIPTLLFAKLDNIYVIMLLISTVWLGAIGFIDDYIKVFKKNKEGLKGKFKVVGQIGIGIIVGSILYFNQDVVVRHQVANGATNVAQAEAGNLKKNETAEKFVWQETKSTKTTIPFVKNNEFDYKWFLSWLSKDLLPYTWLIYIPIVILIITAMSNGANMTDGIDGLAAGTSAIIGVAIAVFAFVSGNQFFADYLNVMYIPHSGEIVVFSAAFVGAAVGFLWYNSYPAQVFMGDTGSLALGGIIAVMSLSVRKELILPLLAGIFLAENLSVMLQVGWFKYTKKKYGEGRRIFLMAPLHHHFQKQGIHESKIVSRFWIVGIMLMVLSIVTLKIR